MNKDEKIAGKFLRTLGLGTPVYEPDGNCPPDFAFKNDVGIEVRRLNQNYFENSETEGLEQTTIRLHQVIKDCFNSFQSDGSSYFVAVEYQRPISQRNKILKKRITEILNEFMNSPRLFPDSYSLNENISLKFIEATKKYNDKFMLGINYDFDDGGWLTELLVENTSFCVQEKSLKIKKYESNYKEWWLLLVDHIGLNTMESGDYSELKHYSLIKGNFQKVIIIDPNSTQKIFSY